MPHRQTWRQSAYIPKEPHSAVKSQGTTEALNYVQL